MYVYVNVCVYINISIICICMFMYFYLYAYVHVGNLHGALSSVSIQGFVIRISSLNPKPKPSNLNPSGPVKGLGMFRVQGQESWNIILLVHLKQGIGDPSTNRPKFMFQLAGIHSTGP